MPFENGLIDLRSDTVTVPTPEMRRAMAAAEVGDDVYRDDPTVNRLEERAAALTGKAAALFVPSGTMANLLALMVHCAGHRGVEVIVGDKSHIYLNEVGGLAALVGAQAAVVANQPDGSLGLADVEAAIRADDVHHPRTRLICLENTQNICGGVVVSPGAMAATRALALRHGLKVHLDGARLFNAAVALGAPATTLTQHADSVMFCLSKGLGAPVGSMLCGEADLIDEARRYRKMVGGGMRQAGVIAAAGLIALEHMIERLEDDHVNARRLAAGLADLPGLTLENPEPQTNMVYLQLDPARGITGPDVAEALRGDGIVLDPGPYGFRLVTHAWITPGDVDQVIAGFRSVLGRRRKGQVCEG
ncbi:MAG: low-specificity L-threonine aldolase [Anaerolineales bacterium]|nr:low-specificity L-threonine aldolase [Anaerolineales bacterium]